MVPFGFSAGDFATAIGLIVRISKALKDSGGAVAEYRALLQDLQTLQQLLGLLEKLRPAGGSLGHVNAIRGMALTFLVPLQEFVAKIERSYESTLSVGSSANIFRRGVKKVKWAVAAEEDFTKFRILISTKVVSIAGLLGAINCETLARIEEHNDSAQKTLIDRINENADGLDSKLSSLLKSHHEALSTKVSQLRADIRENMSSHTAKMSAGQRVLTKKADEQMDRVEGLGHQLDQVTQETRSGLNLLCDIARRLLNSIVPFSTKVLAYLRENMRANMETYALLLKIQESIPRRLFLSQQDSIHFEDVLGRTKYLPYDYFRHWEVFESMLRCEFKDRPGEAKIFTGDYVLMNALLHGITIEREAWQQMVFPGTKIKMSVIIKTFKLRQGYCPRPQCPGNIDIAANITVAHCPICSLAFVPKANENARRYRVTVAGREPHLDPSRQEPSRVRKRAREYKRQNLQRSLATMSSRKGLKDRELLEIQAFRMIHINPKLQNPETAAESATKDLPSVRPQPLPTAPSQPNPSPTVDSSAAEPSFISSRTVQPSKNGSCLQHDWQVTRTPGYLLIWICRICHSGPHWMIQACQKCSLKVCDKCSQKTEPDLGRQNIKFR